MRKAGDLLSAIIDEKTLGKAREYSKLFSAWEQLTKKHGIAAAAYHSRIQDVRRGILLAEADHPGWIQLLQTREHLLLSDLQKMFPALGLDGIAFVLSKASPPSSVPVSEAGTKVQAAAGHAGAHAGPAAGRPADANEVTAGGAQITSQQGPAERSGYDRIKDGTFKDKLKSLEESITGK